MLSLICEEITTCHRCIASQIKFTPSGVLYVKNKVYWYISTVSVGL